MPETSKVLIIYFYFGHYSLYELLLLGGTNKFLHDLFKQIFLYSPLVALYTERLY